MSGPVPAYRPTFPATFLALARQTVRRRRTVSFQLHQRAALVLLLHEWPCLSNVAAGAQVGLHPDSVRAWRRRWAAGQFSFEDEPGRGCKARFSPPGSGRRQGPRL
jgi:hypothetical protein